MLCALHSQKNILQKTATLDLFFHQKTAKLLKVELTNLFAFIISSRENSVGKIKTLIVVFDFFL